MFICVGSRYVLYVQELFMFCAGSSLGMFYKCRI